MTEGRSAAILPGRVRLEFGVAGGLVAACAMSIGVMILSALNLVQFAWFPMFGEIFGAPGLVSEAAMYGLLASLIFGMVWGAIFAFAFKTYTVMKGLGIAAIEFFVVAAALSMVETTQLQGTLISLGFYGALPILLGLAVALAIWGASMGYIGKRYLP